VRFIVDLLRFVFAGGLGTASARWKEPLSNGDHWTTGV